MRYALPCPACGGSTRFVVVRGEVQTSCRRCDVRAAVRRACCGGAPEAEELTGAAGDDACWGCGEARAIEPGPIRAPTALAGDDARPIPEPEWAPLSLDERASGSPYRDGRCAGLTIRRPAVGLRQLALGGAMFGWPALFIALAHEPLAAAGWLVFAAVTSALLVFGARPVQSLDASVAVLEVQHGGFRGEVVTTRAAAVRRVFWAGRGARCALWAQTEGDHVLLFDALAPDQAAALERKVEQVLGLDREDRSRGAEARLQ